MRLYIIGNGFDLHHRLRTKYIHFAYYLRENYSETYENLVKYFGLPEVSEDEPSDDDWQWNYFESKLSDLDTDEVMEEASEYAPNIASDDFKFGDLHGMEQVNERLVNQLTVEMVDAFKEFICQVKFPETIDDLRVPLEAHSLFLNFNYTNTLERYYDVASEQICYLHGNAQVETDVLVLGHGIDPAEFVDKQDLPPDNLAEEERLEWEQDQSDRYDYSYESARERLYTYFANSFKKTDELIEKHSDFFVRLENVDEVVVIGHSLSAVDRPYLLKVKQSVRPDAKWSASYHGSKEGPTRRQQLLELGVPENFVRVFVL